MKVTELMSQPAHTCRTYHTLTTPAQLMWDHRCGSVPVLDDESRLVGIVTDRDIAMAAYLQGRSLHQIGVAEVMTASPVSCHPDDDHDEALRLMQRHHVRRVPVVDDQQQLLGVLSIDDFAVAATRRGTGIAGADVATALASTGAFTS